MASEPGLSRFSLWGQTPRQGTQPAQPAGSKTQLVTAFRAAVFQWLGRVVFLGPVLACVLLFGPPPFTANQNSAAAFEGAFFLICF